MKNRALTWAAALLLAVQVFPLSARADVQMKNGLSLGFGLAQVTMGSVTVTTKNYASSSPLAFSPLELGYRWANGLLLKFEIQLFYYDAETRDVEEAAQVTVDENGNEVTKTILIEKDKLTTYEYSATSFSFAATYDIQMPLAVRPYVGAAVQVVSSKRRAVSEKKLDPLKNIWGPSTRVIAEQNVDAWGLVGASAIAGLRWRITPRWSVKAEGRYLIPFGGPVPPLSTVGLGVELHL